MRRWSSVGRTAVAVGGSVALAIAVLALGYPSSPSVGRFAVAAVRQQAGEPVAAFADPGDVTVGTSVTVNGGASQGTALNYGWDFGDGTPAMSGATARHEYTAVDDY